VEKSYYFGGMNRSLLSLIALCLSCTALFSQEVIEIGLRAPKSKPQKSPYDTITFMDSRQDTTNIGVYYYGLGDKSAKMILKQPFQPQLMSVLKACTDGSAGHGELLFQLRRFSFAERTRTKYVYLIASLYAKRDDRYIKLSDLDVTMIFDDEWALQMDLERTSNGVLAAFLARGIQEPGQDFVTYSYDDVVHIDSIVKRRLLAYNVSTYNEGLYSNYAAFTSQTPDVKGEVKLRSDGGFDVKIHSPEWRDPKEGRHIFAVVYGGMPYIVTHFGYYPLEKKDGDFYFTGKLRVASTQQEKAGAQFVFGMVGRALALDKGVYRVVLDPATGEFIHLKLLAEENK
jgi:hypothetical protein